jgi:non-specific serine/threonine protein kinase/serine/threonine-protein kinase
MNSSEVRARFNAERQALALMDHAGIAKVLQAGETEAGDPFFAMELVKGLTITEYCDTKRLSTKERLKLFVDVCHAVQHAHQKGVIHRDLKPSNVMITEQDGEPLPKIIDFGIAKALGLQLTEATLVTQVGQPLGTAAYMSPEQAESSGLDVDTRSDIYSLGVILYTILVGSLPVDPSGLPMHAFIYRLASKETQAPRPSTRFTSLGEYRKGIADARHTDPDHLVRELSGDLDWIVMKALEPERSRRYDTAIGLATDIERYLTHQTVTARPPTTAYRVRKFVRRHRTAVAATSVTVLALILSAVLATAGMVRATRAERLAANEAAAAKQVSDFLVALFRLSDPGEARGNNVTARELLDKGADQAAANLARQPEIQSRMLHTIGTAYSSLGLYDAAKTQLQKALDTRITTLGPDHTAVAESELALGDAMASHGEIEEAERHYQRALAINEKAYGTQDTRVGRVVSSVASLRYMQGRLDEAESLYKRAIAIDERAPEDSLPYIVQDLLGLGGVYWALGRYPEAEQHMRRSLAIQERRLGPNHLDVGSIENNIGALYWSQGKYGEALPHYERARSIFARTLDPMHPHVASNFNNLAETYWKLRRFREADSLFRRALTIKEARLTRDNPTIATTLNGLAGSLRDQRRYAEAEQAYRRALDIRQRGLSRGDPNITETVRDYAVLLRATGRAAEADAIERENGVEAVRKP